MRSVRSENAAAGEMEGGKANQTPTHEWRLYRRRFARVKGKLSRLGRGQRSTRSTVVMLTSDGDVDGDRVWMTCSSGAVLVRVQAFG